MASVVDCLAAKVSLLHLLHNLPEPPSVNEPGPEIREREHCKRTLTLKHEISITQHLAFICSYSSNPLHVTAVCIEETLAHSSLILRLTANTGQHEGLVNQLTKAARILQDEASGIQRQANKAKLSQLVIALNRNRILSRIRSRHAACYKSRGKASVLKRLRTAAQLLQGSLIDPVRVKRLIEEVDSLQAKFEAVEGDYGQNANPNQLDDHLLVLIEGVHSFLVRCETDLRRIPYTPGAWSGNATDALIDRLRKISQYTTACDELLRAARRYIVFASITVHFVDFQQSGKSLDSGRSAEEVLEARSICKTLSRVSNHRHEKQVVTERLIKERLNRATRLHAEIQLVLFYERYDSALPPRVICASKRACYLCNLFFKLHGAYHIPDTHGKLYETWRWPASSMGPGDKAYALLGSILPAFVEAIDLKTEEILSRGRTPARVEPFESTVDLLKAMTPSIRSEAMTNLSSSLLSIFSRQNRSGAPTRTPVALKDIPAERIRAIERPRSPVASLSASSARLSSRSSKISTAMTITEAQSVSIGQGQAINYNFSKEDKSLLVCTRHLNVHLSFVASPRRTNSCVEMEIECLPWSEYQDQVGNLSLVDLQGENWVVMDSLEHSLYSASGLLLRQQTTLLRLRGHLTPGSRS